MKTSHRQLVTITGFLLLSPLLASGALIFYESFAGNNFVTGSAIDSTPSNIAGNTVSDSFGATGQSGGWGTRTPSGSGTVTIENESLSYSGGSVEINGSGKVLRITPSSAFGTFTGCDIAFPTEYGWGASVSPSEVGAGNSLYGSVLFRLSGGVLNFEIAQFGLIAGTIDGTGAMRPAIGMNNRNDDKFAVGLNSAGPTGTIMNSAVSSIDPLPGNTYFLVFKLDSDGTSWTLNTLWVNPQSVTFGVDTASAVSADAARTDALQAIGFSVSNIDSNENISLGEFRLGTNWADVVVPEPAHYTWLVLLSALFMAALRRRS